MGILSKIKDTARGDATSDKGRIKKTLALTLDPTLTAPAHESAEAYSDSQKKPAKPGQQAPRWRASDMSKLKKYQGIK